uniref:Uncharacterized protein n=1 Tax=Megaselia scalaris TaxID=36166 RepID=T1GC26_MEGSC
MDNIPRTHEDIEAQIRDIQTKKKEIQKTQSDQGVSLLDKGGFFDTDLYDDGAGKDKYEGYNTSIATNDEMEEDEDEGLPVPQKRTSYTAPKSVMKEVAKIPSLWKVGEEKEGKR